MVARELPYVRLDSMYKYSKTPNPITNSAKNGAMTSVAI